ncbi:MAG: nucleotidyl transferase AbiEii/AbiGii toxin family protein [Thermoanaerobaculales bacterium]|nr:nucleotidyl transferase AbiEii/AbiGii toxin family protein [Thermoanaerobaculales bacterium]
MKEYLRQLVAERAVSGVDPRNIAREYLQARILLSLQRSGAMVSIAFHGGTALRFLYAIPRFSEDLDFALEHVHHDFDFRRTLRRVRADLQAEGYTVDIRLKESTPVLSGLIKFSGLPFELGLSGRRSEILRIKVEIDSHPPPSAGLKTTLIRRFVTLNLHHHDRATLLSGKLHAVLQRPWTKGRDLYDLMWYLSDPDWPEPNLIHLNNALTQSGWEGPELFSSNWHEIVLTKVKDLDWPHVQADVRPFLETRTEVDLFTADNLAGLLV